MSMVVHKGRVNTKTLKLNMDTTGETIKSEIRERPDIASPLIATWTVTEVDEATGEYNLFLDDSDSLITQATGFMDVIRISGGQPIPCFNRVLAIEFEGSVTHE